MLYNNDNNNAKLHFIEINSQTSVNYLPRVRPFHGFPSKQNVCVNNNFSV